MRDLDVYGPPNASAQAMALLDVCGNDLEAARGMCRTNAMNAADDAGFLYWAHVLKAMLVTLDSGIEHLIERGHEC